MNIAMLAEMAAQGAAERTALGDSAREGRGNSARGMSYGALWDSCTRAAAWFGRRPARNIAFLGVSSSAFPIALFGAALADRPFAPLNYRWSADQLCQAVLRLAQVTVIIDAEFVGLSAELAETEGVEFVGTSRFLDELSEIETGWLATVPEPQNPAALLFTSGTSGAPKVAVLRHENLSSYILGTVDFLAGEPEEAQLVSVPPYHVGGIANLLSSLYAGRRIVQLPDFQPSRWIETVQQQRITHGMVVPTMLARIVAELERTPRALPSLRHLSYGGGRMPLPVVRQAMRLLPEVGFVNGYGLTETSSTITVLGPQDHWESAASADPLVRRRLGSVGRPLPSVDVSIRDSAGNPLPAGEVGELWVRGEQISGEYAETGSTRDSEGWFHTKDSAFVDDEGYVFVEGRLDDVIVRGGENLAPGEIEDVLLNHPEVADAGVIGLPDDDWGEKVIAAVVAVPDVTPDTQALREWVRRHLRSAKTPSEIEVVRELPYNDNGKLLRRQLRVDLGAAWR